MQEIPSVETHTRQLQHPDPDLKREAVRKILASPSPEGERTLVELVADPSHGVREAAAQALRVVGGRVAIGALIPLLYSEHPHVRNSAIELLVAFGSPVVPRVAALQRDPDPDIRKFSADILGAVGSRESLLPLLVLLDDPNPNVQHAAAEALGRLGLPEAVPRLTALLSVPGPHWYPVVTALGQIGDPSAAPVLLSALADADPMTAVAILDTVGRLGDEAAYERVACLIEEARCSRSPKQTRLVVAACFKALLQLSIRLGHPLPFLDQSFVIKNVDALLDEGDHNGVIASIRAYGAMIPPKWAPRIVALAESEGAAELVAFAAELCRGLPAIIVPALESCPAALREALLERLVEDPTPQVVEALVEGLSRERIADHAELIEALGRIGDPRAVGTMLAILREGDSWLKARTAEALGRMGAVEAVPTLLELITEGEEEEEVLTAYVRAVKTIDPSTVGLAFPDLLAHRDPVVRRAAVEALGAGLEDLTLLLPLSQDPDPSVRRAAVRFLPRLPSSLEPLLLALLDEDAGVRRAAVRAIAALEADEAAVSLESLYREEADPQVRCEIVVALRDQMSAQAKPLLLGALSDPAPLVRVAAACAFGVSGDPQEPATRAQLRELGDPELTAALSDDPVGHRS